MTLKPQAPVWIWLAAAQRHPRWKIADGNDLLRGLGREVAVQLSEEANINTDYRLEKPLAYLQANSLHICRPKSIFLCSNNKEYLKPL